VLRVTLNGMTTRASITRNVIGCVRDVVEGFASLANGGLLRSFVEVGSTKQLNRTYCACRSQPTQSVMMHGNEHSTRCYLTFYV